METRVRPFSPDAIADAARLIGEGALVAMPTETVYGLAADATNDSAVAAIYAAKGRPAFNPLIVHVLDLDAAEQLATIDPIAHGLAEAFWPGPLTIVAPLRAQSGIAMLATAGLSTVAIRAPAHLAMRALLQVSKRPLAAPSANASNALSPTRAEHVVQSLGGGVPLVIDGGPCHVGLESTIVRVCDGTIRVLRHGPVTASQLRESTGLQVATHDGGTITVPGQLAHHYAPTKRLRLDATSALPDEWLIGFGTIGGDATLSPGGDLTEAAARLFELLHAADTSSAGSIAVAPVPDHGLGRAINDRLRRGAA